MRYNKGQIWVGLSKSRLRPKLLSLMRKSERCTRSDFESGTFPPEDTGLSCWKVCASLEYASRYFSGWSDPFFFTSSTERHTTLHRDDLTSGLLARSYPHLLPRNLPQWSNCQSGQIPQRGRIPKSAPEHIRLYAAYLRWSRYAEQTGESLFSNPRLAAGLHSGVLFRTVISSCVSTWA